MSDLILIERILDTTPILPDPLPPNVIKESIDSDWVNPLDQETTTSTAIRSQPFLVTPTDPVIYLHSKLKNTSYEDMLGVMRDDHNFLVDRSSSLKSLYNVDFYDGDQTLFLDKISNIADTLNMEVPTLLLPYIAAEYALIADKRDVTKENDFLRNIIKRVWLLRVWSGTTKGHILLFKLINRLGALHIGAKYKQGTAVDTSTEIMFRFLNLDELSRLLPESSSYPDSVHIDGATNFNEAASSMQKYDTSHIWDEDPIIYWDETISSLDYGKTLLMEISLDRMLYHTNKIGTNESLMDDAFLQSIDLILPYIRKANNNVVVGSQISLVASKDGHYNTALNPIWTHPNIQANFETIKSTFTSSENVSYIKLGSSGYKVLNTYFIPYDVNFDINGIPEAPYTIPTDLYAPILQSAIGQNERSVYGGYSVLSPTIHSRNISTNGTNLILDLNGMDVLPIAQKPNLIQLTNTLITEGSLRYNIDFSIYRGCNLSVSVLQPPKAADILILGTTVSFTVEDATNESNVIKKILSTTFNGWDVQFNAGILTFKASNSNSDNNAIEVVNLTDTNINLSISNTENGIEGRSVFQKILISEKPSKLNKAYNSLFKYRTLSPLGSEMDTGDDEVLHGYTIDSTYIPAVYNYMPEASTKGIVLNQLYEIDLYPSLFNGLVLNLNMDSFPEIPDGAQSTYIYKKESWENSDISDWTTTGGSLSVDNGVLILNKESIGTTNIIGSFTTPIEATYLHLRVKADAPANLVVLGGIIGSMLPLHCYVDESLSTDSKIFIYKIVTTGSTDISISSTLTSLDSKIYIEWMYIGDSSYTSKVVNDVRSNIQHNDDNIHNGNATISNCRVIDGVYNKALIIGDTLGLTGEVICDTNANLDGLASLSFSGFISVVSSVTEGIIISKCDGSGSSINRGWEISYDLSGYVVIWVATTGVNARFSYACSSGTKHIAITFSSFNSTPNLYIDGEYTAPTSINSHSGSYIPDTSSERVNIGFNSHSLSVQEVRIYNRALTLSEVVSLYNIRAIRNNLRYNIDGDPEYVYIDSAYGLIIFKAQYNIDGIFNQTQEATESYSIYNTNVDQAYSLNSNKNVIAISEMGLFNSNDVMVAYATFPPIIYNASIHHLSFNILIQN